MSDGGAGEDDLILSGIDATTGQPVVATVRLDAVVLAARGLPPEPVVPGIETLGGPRTDVLNEAGWGVIFAHDASDDLREALQPLLDLRAEQAKSVYREFRGDDGYTAPERAVDFRVRHQQPRGTPIPSKVPYYLLLVGGPDVIPFEFQYGLALNHFVGRIAFDALEDYARYATTVVAAEKRELRRAHTLALFGPENVGDRATRLSSSKLVAPVATAMQDRGFASITVRARADATKAALVDLLRAGNAPGLLMTASHGISFPTGNADQRLRQGALLCQDWRPGVPGPLSPDVYFAAADVPSDADVAGMIALHFACYGVGTPQRDNYARYIGGNETLAPAPFVAALPTRLLSHPNGSALAVIGHVDRAWGFSFTWPGLDDDTATFSNLLTLIGDGTPVGLAMQRFRDRYVDLSGTLNEMLQDQQAKARDIAWSWVGSNDARNYIILGDPAVRLPETP